jgi:hypothetical protein
MPLSSKLKPNHQFPLRGTITKTPVPEIVQGASAFSHATLHPWWMLLKPLLNKMALSL